LYSLGKTVKTSDFPMNPGESEVFCVFASSFA